MRRARERLNLRVRDVEQAKAHLGKIQNPEFTVLINRLFEIENNGLVPGIYRLYALTAIYRLDFAAVLEWYGIHLAALPADALFADVFERALHRLPGPAARRHDGPAFAR